MSADISDTIGELRELLCDIREQAEQTSYGIFPGGDPRTFTPDFECSTVEERAAHKGDCERVERGEPPQTVTRCYVRPTDDDGGVQLVTPKGYGFGVYTIEDPQAKDWAERLERYIAQLEGWLTEVTP